MQGSDVYILNQSYPTSKACHALHHIHCIIYKQNQGGEIRVTEVIQAEVVQLLSHVWFFMTPWTLAPQASQAFTLSWSLLKLMSIEWVMPSNCLIFCCSPLLLLSIFPSIRVFFGESVLCIRWPTYWSFSLSIESPNEYSGLISFRIGCFVLLAVQGTLKSLLQHHKLKASILWCLAFFRGSYS